MNLDIQTLETISSLSIYITGSIFCLYVIIAGCIDNKKTNRNLDVMLTVEKELEREF